MYLKCVLRVFLKRICFVSFNHHCTNNNKFIFINCNSNKLINNEFENIPIKTFEKLKSCKLKILTN